MIPLLLILLSTVAWGADTSMLDGITSRLANEPPTTYPAYIIDEKPKYVVEVTTKTLPDGFYRDGSRKYTQYNITALTMVCNIYEDSKDKTACNVMYDLAEALNEAHRRRVK